MLFLLLLLLPLPLLLLLVLVEERCRRNLMGVPTVRKFSVSWIDGWMDSLLFFDTLLLPAYKRSFSTCSREDLSHGVCNNMLVATLHRSSSSVRELARIIISSIYTNQ